MLDQVAIRNLRMKRKLSMEEAAVRAGMRTRQDWNKFENGAISDPRASTLYAMSQCLGCLMEDLLKRPKK